MIAAHCAMLSEQGAGKTVSSAVLKNLDRDGWPGRTIPELPALRSAP
jgi:hypothetical protein